MTSLLRATAAHSGAIAIIQLLDDDGEMLGRLTGISNWPVHRVRLVDLAGIDHGLAVRISPTVSQIMPHGGPRIVQRLTQRLLELGAQIIQAEHWQAASTRLVFPEAADDVEALMMQALSRAESPLAIDLLLDQPRRWRTFRKEGQAIRAADIERANRLNRLIRPALVVIAVAPNVGKSTLSNALLGRSISIALDIPGTTRDYIAGRLNLGGLVVDWHDTPGFRESNDQIERKAIEISQRLISRADLLIVMREATSHGRWPTLPRQPDVRVISKIDLAKPTQDDPSIVLISATVGTGLPELVCHLRQMLVPDSDLNHPGPWLFDDRLTQFIAE